MELFYCSSIALEFYLDADESRHCIKVLRKTAGDIIHVTDGNGNIYKCQISETNFQKCPLVVISNESVIQPTPSIHIAIAPTKSLDRMEFFVEKAVEIGVNEITFIQTKYSERTKLKVDRIRKKAIGAMKQSVRAMLPEIKELTKLDSFIPTVVEDSRFVAHLDDDHDIHLKSAITQHDDTLIIIGPEGGFSRSELDLLKKNNFKLVKLGNYRLRTETAGIVACSIFANLHI